MGYLIVLEVSNRRVAGRRLSGSGSPRHVKCTTA
jgi:hypothetical protein